MAVATQDLPDPLDATPTMAIANPDDLLAKMADEAIDRLMADADNGSLPTAPPVPMSTVANEPVASAAAEADVSSAVPPDAPATDDAVPPVTDEAGPRVDDAVPPSVPGNAVVPPVAPVIAPEAAAHAALADVDVHATLTVLPPAPAADRQALLHAPETAPRASVLLWPLRVVNAPFRLSDDARRLVGLMAIVTLLPSAIAIGFVLWSKYHH